MHNFVTNNGFTTLISYETEQKQLRNMDMWYYITNICNLLQTTAKLGYCSWISICIFIYVCCCSDYARFSLL